MNKKKKKQKNKSKEKFEPFNEINFFNYNNSSQGKQAAILPMKFNLNSVACMLILIFLLLVDFSTTSAISSFFNPTSHRSVAAATSSSLSVISQQQIGNNNGKLAARYKTIYACEDTLLVMKCENGTQINLIRANYGRFSITQCNENARLDLSTDCMSPITFRIMKERCQDKQECNVTATSSIFGDKCPKTRKYLEVHFQCQQDLRNSQLYPASASQQQLPTLPLNAIEPDRVDLRNTSLISSSPSVVLYPPTIGTTTGTNILPPNNPTIHQQQQQQHQRQASMPASPSVANNPMIDSDSFQQRPSSLNQQQPLLPFQQQPTTVMNSEILSYDSIADSKSIYNPNNISSEPSIRTSNENIIVTLRHIHTENVSNPRCVRWDPSIKQWTERGSQLINSNLTHTICAFDQATSYLLVMDYLADNPAPPTSHSTVSKCRFNNLFNWLSVEGSFLATQP